MCSTCGSWLAGDGASTGSKDPRTTSSYGSPTYKDGVTALEHARQRGYREMEALLAQ
ncbi:hypothetical protein PPUJ20005_53910 [Pseudomonas putida]|nr:hypothetical protein PPUJ20005_53910 [Pseudomonas putida]